MTKLLEKAFEKASNLPQKKQNVIAAIVLEEIDTESKWDKLFINSQDKLALLADEALKEFKAGKTKPF